MVHVFLLGESPYFFLIVAVVLDLISYFDVNNISLLVQRSLPKTLKYVSCSDFLSQMRYWPWVASFSCTSLWLYPAGFISIFCLLLDLMVSKPQLMWILSCFLDHKHLIPSNGGVCFPEVFLSSFWVQLYLFTSLHAKPIGSYIIYPDEVRWFWPLFPNNYSSSRFVAERGFTILLFLGILISKMQLGHRLNIKWMEWHSFSPMLFYESVNLTESYLVVQGALQS